MGSTAKHIVEEKKRQKSNRPGCIVLVVLIVVGSVLLWQYILGPLFASGMGMADTREIAGDATNFDPIASFADVQAYAGENTQLVSIDAYYVRSDGTMDLTATNYSPHVEYDFVREVPRPADAPPVGAGGTLGKWYEPISVEAYQPGKWWNVSSSSGDYSFMNKGLEREVDRPTSSEPSIVPAPRCSFASLWEEALKHDAPRDAVATIGYDQYGYDFYISGLSISLDFDENCKVTD